MLSCISEGSNQEVLLALQVQPRASRDRICGLYNDRLKVAVTSPPVDNKANAYLLKYLAKVLKLSKSNVVLDSGKTSRRKVVRLLGVTADELDSILHSLLPSPIGEGS